MALPTHRSVSSIRPTVPGSHSPAAGAPGSPHTPIRTISSTYGSPSTLRAEEDCIVVEFGTRSLRVGLAGDALPKAVIDFGPELLKRAGDYRSWDLGHDLTWRGRVHVKDWGNTHELWKLDLRGVDLGLVGDKIERAMREAFTKYLLIDSRPRRLALVLPSALPLPLLSTIVNKLFHQFQAPTISLISAPVAATVSAGVRNALVIDIGWAETVVTAVYEYREVISRRSIRGRRLLGQEFLKLIGDAVIAERNRGIQTSHEVAYEDLISFEECEDIISRTSWCRVSSAGRNIDTLGGLASVQEEEESPDDASNTKNGADKEAFISIPLTSAEPPTTIQLPFLSLTKPCETAFFADGVDLHDLDDEELPLHQLVYRALLYLPVDIRSVCMSRILFTGGASNIPGLRERIMDDVGSLIRKFRWNPVQGKVVDRMKTRSKTYSNRPKQANDGPTSVEEQSHDRSGIDISSTKTILGAGLEDQEPDPIEEHLKREASKNTPPIFQGVLRAIDCLGAWTGASLLSQLKIPIVSFIEREQWLQHGITGASRSGEVNITKQRQSMGPGGLRAGTGEQLSWTLGIWG